MKVGDYVRTKSGFIDKIININDFREPSMIYALEQPSWSNDVIFIGEEEIIKSSPNIIDLIEEHDILKIEEQKGVYTICEVEAFREPYTNYNFLGVSTDNKPIARKLYELNIKSIVTKEMFTNAEYRVETN